MKKRRPFIELPPKQVTENLRLLSLGLKIHAGEGGDLTYNQYIHILKRCESNPKLINSYLNRLPEHIKKRLRVGIKDTVLGLWPIPDETEVPESGIMLGEIFGT